MIQNNLLSHTLLSPTNFFRLKAFNLLKHVFAVLKRLIPAGFRIVVNNFIVVTVLRLHKSEGSCDNVSRFYSLTVGNSLARDFVDFMVSMDNRQSTSDKKDSQKLTRTKDSKLKI